MTAHTQGTCNDLIIFCSRVAAAVCQPFFHRSAGRAAVAEDALTNVISRANRRRRRRRDSAREHSVGGTQARGTCRNALLAHGRGSCVPNVRSLNSEEREVRELRGVSTVGESVGSREEKNKYTRTVITHAVPSIGRTRCAYYCAARARERAYRVYNSFLDVILLYYFITIVVITHCEALAEVYGHACTTVLYTYTCRSGEINHDRTARRGRHRDNADFVSRLERYTEIDETRCYAETMG